MHISHPVTNFEFLYEPFYVAPDTVPPHDERFVGYGYTRNTQVSWDHVPTQKKFRSPVCKFERMWFELDFGYGGPETCGVPFFLFMNDFELLLDFTAGVRKLNAFAGHLVLSLSSNRRLPFLAGIAGDPAQANILYDPHLNPHPHIYPPTHVDVA